MTKKALLLLLTLLTTSAMWAQSVPPMGTKYITLEVQPDQSTADQKPTPELDAR